MKCVITEYVISGCWYGRKRQGTSVNPSELLSVLGGFRQWVNCTKRMEDTRIEGKTFPFEVYVKDCACIGHDFLISLWLSSTDAKNNIYTIKRDSPPDGTQEVKKRKFDDEDIPGLPTYFFIPADDCRMFAVRPKNLSVNGRTQFDAAIKHYMAKFAKKIPKEKAKLDDGTVLLSLKMTDEKGKDLSPKFESELKEVPSVAKKLLSHAQDVRKIIHTRTLVGKSPKEKKMLIGNLLSIFDADLDDESFDDSEKMRCEIDVNLTPEEIGKLIKNQDKCKAGERYGFLLKGGSSPIWADSCIARKEVDLEVSVNDDIPISAKAMLNGVESSRVDIMKG